MLADTVNRAVQMFFVLLVVAVFFAGFAGMCFMFTPLPWYSWIGLGYLYTVLYFTLLAVAFALSDRL